MAIRPQGLEWTVLAPGGGVQSRKSPLRGTEEPPAREGWADRFAAQLAAEESMPRGDLHLAIPSDGLLLRVLDLPSVDPAEIQGMVELQIDQFSPFPIDLLHLSWETLSRTESRSRVLVTGARRSQIEKLGAAATACRRRILRIDADVLAWLHLLRKADKIPAEGRHLLVLDEAASPMLIVLDQGQPILFRSLPLPPSSDPDWQTILSEEMGMALAEVEADWGAAPILGCRLLHWGAEPHGVAVLGRELGVPVQAEPLGVLDVLSDGVAGRADARLDLSPQAWKDAAAAQGQRRRILLLAGAAVGLWALGWAIFLGLLSFRESSVASLRQEVEDLAKPAEEVKQLERELEFLSAFTNRTETVLDCMREVVRHLPNSGLQLTDFTFKKGQGVSVKGQGASTPVLAYTKVLGASPLFKLDEIQVENGRFDFVAKLASAPPPETEARAPRVGRPSGSAP